MNYRFFDSASTTPCTPDAARLIERFAVQDFGNPSSGHLMGQRAAAAIRDARLFFAQTFRVEPNQVIFTGSGSEADNLAIYGTALGALAKKKSGRILCSAIEHPAVRKTVQSLTGLGFDAQLIPVDAQAQINSQRYLELLNPETLLISIHQVNNITGAILPVEKLAELAKARFPEIIFHTDSIQAFGKIPHPTASSAVDLVSISGHKIGGPKGVGALIVLNKKLLQGHLRPQIWGGDQENGFRSGSQNAGLIAGFHSAAQQALSQRDGFIERMNSLRELLHSLLTEKKLKVRWNSPAAPEAVPHIVSLSVPDYPAGPLARLLEERGFLISTGSACSSQKSEPDPILTAMGLPPAVTSSAIRVSFSDLLTQDDIVAFVEALDDSLRLMSRLMASSQGGRKNK